jgi:hypothetical protein
MGLVNPVGVDQKKGGKDGIYLLNHGTTGVGKKMIIRRTLFAAPIPEILYPGPGFVVDVDKILVIEVDFGEIPLGHSVLSPLWINSTHRGYSICSKKSNLLAWLPYYTFRKTKLPLFS